MISIVIPVYNVEAYLDQCIESVLKLTTNIEVVLVDDGSTDGSGELCDRWADIDSRITVIHQDNCGLSGARNTGIMNSKGEFVMFVDSDDFLNLEQTDLMLTQLQSGVNVLMGLYRNYYADNDRHEPEFCENFLSVEGTMPIARFLPQIPSDGRSCILTAWRFICNREFLMQNNLLFLPGIYHEDEEWTQRMLCCAEQILVTHQYFYEYRQARTGAITSSVKPKHIFDSFTIMERTRKLMCDVKTDSNKYRYLGQRMANLCINCMIHFCSLNPDDRKHAKERLKEFYPVCAPFMNSGIGKTVRIFVELFGIYMTCICLAVARWIIKGNSKRFLRNA